MASQSEVEQKLKSHGFIIINREKQKPTLLRQFKMKAEKKQQEYIKQGKPFCFTCARYDFLDWYNKNQVEMARTDGQIDFEALKTNLPELEEYGNPERFKLIGQSEKMDEGKWKGDIPKMVVYNDYECIERKCKLSIEIKRYELPTTKTQEVSNMQQQKTSTK